MVLNSPEPAMNKMLRQHVIKSFIYLGRFHFCTVVGIMGYKNNHSYSLTRFYSPGPCGNAPLLTLGNSCVFDNCSHTISDKGWALGIRSGKDVGRRDARFFFSLRTDRVKKATTVMGHSRYQPGKWTHVAATYDGQRMALYVDGTQVASSPDQSGPLNSPFMASCRFLLLGGDSSENGHSFRGHLGTLVFWSTALPQSHLQHSPQQPMEVEDLTTLVLTASFEPLEEQWAPFRDGKYPRLEVLQGFESEPEILSPLQPPLCGQTACDNVELISQYNGHWPLRGEKVIRYQVVNICDDEGLNPTVSEEQIRRQHEVLNEAFGRYNISWQLSIHHVHNSTLRHRVVLVNCEPSKIGNDHCDPECEHPLTGYDGGDCRLQGRCYSWNRRDGLCHVECNNMLNDFDDGDCCDPDTAEVHKTCFDPDSPRRTAERLYLSKEARASLQRTNKVHIDRHRSYMSRETQVQSLGWKDPLEEEMATHSSTLSISIMSTNLNYLQNTYHLWCFSCALVYLSFSGLEYQFLLHSQCLQQQLKHICLFYVYFNE
ncbi:hypothetical protein FD754_019683 [Muntiacus muntjak]|uniref:Pappalysin 2 n=1 Tax=Muntiacus muntjak TaxID=9888 RepID=A0A5N3V0Y9_MUNMU|nr:hypothetical protein FD754_019683 [Muntiacus muntjak]